MGSTDAVSGDITSRISRVMGTSRGLVGRVVRVRRVALRAPDKRRVGPRGEAAPGRAGAVPAPTGAVRFYRAAPGISSVTPFSGEAGSVPEGRVRTSRPCPAGSRE